MIRQMGISPGIMNFYTFGTLNHPNKIYTMIKYKGKGKYIFNNIYY